MTDTANAETTLDVAGLHFTYPGRPVLAGWSARLAPGVTWLRAPNGVGKSTLLKLIGGALAPTAGRIVLGGIDAAAEPLRFRQRCYWCGPDAIAFDHLAVREYFGFVRQLYPTLDEDTLAAQVRAFGLAPWLDTPVAALSTGNGRKAALAVAFSVGTPLVLIDEPLIGLDAPAAAHVRTLLDGWALARDRIALVASHEPPLADPARAHVLALAA